LGRTEIVKVHDLETAPQPTGFEANSASSILL
jgi:hypothetical protein